MSYKEQIDRLTEEIAELTQLSDIAKLASVKTFLSQEINRLKVKKSNITKELENAANIPSAGGDKIVQPNSDKTLGIILVKNYMWDQTDQAVKIYIEVDKDQKIDDTQLSLKIGADSKSFTCVFGKYRLTLGRLLKSIDETKSGVKITKSNRVIITLVKTRAENWASLNVSESALKNALPDEKGPESDPSAGLMKLMKTMYDEGDDEMKRTIAKTWYESRGKQQAGLDPEL